LHEETRVIYDPKRAAMPAKESEPNQLISFEVQNASTELFPANPFLFVRTIVNPSQTFAVFLPFTNKLLGRDLKEATKVTISFTVCHE